VLYNGVDLGRFGRGASTADGQASSREAARREWGVEPDALVFGSVGRLVAVKNYALLLRAFASAGLAARRGRVVLAGEGAERAALEDLARSLGIRDRVHLLGHREDVHRLLPGFDVFVLPSISEGMSNTLLEAMAAGVPPVASNVGGNAEIVRDGVDGRIFPSGDEHALVRELVALDASAPLRAALGAAARARVQSAFDIRAMVERYEQLYERVAARAA